MSFSFNELINKSHLKPVEISVDGLGKVIVHQLSASEAIQCSKDVQKAKTEHELTDILADKACRVLKGSAPTPNEIKKLKSNLTCEHILQIYQKGMEANGTGDDAAEEAEKK